MSRAPPSRGVAPPALGRVTRAKRAAPHPPPPADPSPAAAAATAADAATVPAAPPPRLSASQLLRWERRGHTVTKGVLPPASLAAALAVLTPAARLAAWRHRVGVLLPHRRGAAEPPPASAAAARLLLEAESPEPVGFLQALNLHRRSAAVAAVALGPALAAVAAQLLGCPRVRLYQSAFFLKLPGFGPTNWHSDLNMVPLDTNAFVTAWLPLARLGPDDAGLLFASGSHRDFALPYWRSDAYLARGLEGRGYTLDASPAGLGPGDATWHAGWTLHASPPQPPGRPERAALAVSYFADGAARLPARGDAGLRRYPHGEDAESSEAWLADVPPGAPARHPLLPLVWPPPA